MREDLAERGKKAFEELTKARGGFGAGQKRIILSESWGNFFEKQRTLASYSHGGRVPEN